MLPEQVGWALQLIAMKRKGWNINVEDEIKKTATDEMRELAMMSLAPFAKVVHKANSKWWVDINTGEPIQRNMGEMLMLVTTELAEALEGHRKSMMDQHLPHRKSFDVEIVDALIRIFDIADVFIPDLDAIFWEKMEYNAQRADHKIENRLKADGKKY